MNLKEAHRILTEEIIYKNYAFYIKEDTHSGFIQIRLKAPVKDACSGYHYEVSPVIPITSIDTIDPIHFDRMDREHFLYIIYNMCKRLEMHELDEHFKIEGKCFRDPHPERNKDERLHQRN